MRSFLPGGAADHPRIRGEHARLVLFDAVTVGSSPHTRGAPARRRDIVIPHRIIPAYAGSTAHGFQVRERRRDHPRIRGEHQLALMKPGDLVGSSPHTRGAPQLQSLVNANSRIIPAYAGSTSRSSGRSSLAGDHPRIRGEHRPVQPRPRDHAGSSPHTRGAPVPGDAFELFDVDHPRIRGEHAGIDPQGELSEGSSPHTRGALGRFLAYKDAVGIIPAYAGSTGRCDFEDGHGQDHPRIRGEHLESLGSRTLM